MTTGYRVFMDGQPLDGVSECVIVRDVIEHAPVYDLSAVPMVGCIGQRVTRQVLRSLTVEVQAEVHARRVEERQTVLDAIRAWSRGTWLTTAARPGRRLRVSSARFGGECSQLRWTDMVSILLTACDPPCWEDEQAAEAVLTGRTGTVSLYLPGTMETPVTARIRTNGSTAVENVRIGKGTRYMQLEGVGLVRGETLHIRRSAAGVLELVIEEADGSMRSVYGTRTADSADQLMLAPGRNDMEVSADADVVWTISGRGRWL